MPQSRIFFGLAAVESSTYRMNSFDRHQLALALSFDSGIGQFAQARSKSASHQAADNAEPRTIVGRAAAFLDEAA